MMFVYQPNEMKNCRKDMAIIKEWNPKVFPKYAFVNFDQREIISLEIIFVKVKIFLHDF